MQPFCQDFFIFACRGQRLVVQRDSDGDVRRGQLTAICRLQDQLTQGLALLALVPIWLYRGRQGYHSKPFQYACYAFYPVHMLLLVLVLNFVNQ